MTTPARTLLDLATLLTPRRLHRALDQAEALRLLDVAALHETADGRPGTPALREALATYAPDDIPTRSELEDRMLELCAAYGLPRPRVNTRVEGFEVDAFFAHAGLIVEADGFRHHGTRQAFERDRARDARLVAAGHRVLRVTHRRLVHDAPSVARELRRVLEAAPA